MPIINSFDDKKIYYTIKKGNKNTIIFVHGWTLNHTSWNKEIKHFSMKGYTTIAIDLRGHGKSSKDLRIKEYNIRNFAKDIYAVIKAEKVSNPILIGHSFGGMVLLKFEEMFPRKAKCLIFLDTTYQNPLKDLPIIKNLKMTNITKQLIIYILKRVHLQKKHFKEVDFSRMKKHSDLYYWIKGAENTSFDSILACLYDMVEFNEEKILSKINVPCLIIEGEKDFKTPKKVAEKMNMKIKNSALKFVKGATHDSNIKNSRKVNRIIEDYLNNIGE